MAADITVDMITNGSVVGTSWEGTGVFDRLMGAVNANINLQFESGRIKGAEYAQVYLGSMQAVLQQSIEYIKQEQVIEKEIELKSEQVITERLNQNAIKAKVEDENGVIITDLDGGVQFSTSPETRHHWLVKGLEEAYNKAIEDARAAAANADDIRLGALTKEAVLSEQYDFEVSGDTLVDKNSVTSIDPETFVPKSAYEATMLKAMTEARVAHNTAEGYKADSYYKVYRSLQELLFALTNAGLIPQEDVDGTNTNTNVFVNIVKGMERAMNNQVAVWGSSGIVDLNGNGTNEV